MIVIYLLYLGGHSFITAITTLARPQVHKGHCAEWRGGIIKVMGGWEVVAPPKCCRGALEQGNPPASHIGPWMSWPIRSWDWFQHPPRVPERDQSHQKKEEPFRRRFIIRKHLLHSIPSCYWLKVSPFFASF